MAAGGSGEPDARSPPAPATPARPPPTKDPRLPSDRGHRARQQRASRAALPGRQGLSDLVSPKFMVWFQSKARGGGIVRDQGGNQPNTKRKRPTPTGLGPRGSRLLSRRKSGSGCTPTKSQRAAAPGRPSARDARTSSAAEARRAAGGRPGGSARPAFAQLPPGCYCGARGRRGLEGRPGRGGEERPEPRPQRAELRARRRRRRQDKGDHVRRGGGRGRRSARGGGGGGFSPAAASGFPTAAPACLAAPWANRSRSRRRHRRRGAGGNAPGVLIRGRSLRRAAREALQRSGRRADCAGPAATPGRSSRADRREAPGAGSAPARAPLAGACLSRPLATQVNSIGGHRRRRGLPGWTGGGWGRRHGALAPDFAPRLRQARLLQTLAALGAGLPRRAEPEPPVPPPLLRPAPRAPPLAAPPLGPAPGRPRGGAVPGCDTDSCRCSPRGSARGPHGRLPGGRARRELQRPAPSPQLSLPILRAAGESH